MSTPPVTNPIADLVVKGELDALQKDKDALTQEKKDLTEKVTTLEEEGKTNKEQYEEIQGKLKVYEDADSEELRKFIVENSKYEEKDLEEVSLEGLKGIKEVLGKSKTDVSVQRTSSLGVPPSERAIGGSIEVFNSDKGEWETKEIKKEEKK